MKVLTKSLLAFLLTSGIFLSTTNAVVDDTVPPETDPCAEKVEEGEKLCLEKNEACTTNQDGCCGNYVCAGFSFYKKCIDPPVCHEIWHDCSDGTECCDGLKCIVMDRGKLECAFPKIGSRTVDLGDFHVEAGPTPTPTPPVNLKTTKKPGGPVTKVSASSSGDPHIKTFDGLKYDCQGHGEHILAKSLVTRREVQARYEHLGVNRPISVAKGVAVQDEGDTPLVQVSVATNQDTIGNDMNDGCKLLFFVDRQQKNLEEPYDDGKVKVTMKGSSISIVYTESEFAVNVRYFKCRMNVSVQAPDTDVLVGVLGTNNKNAKDEWTLLDGTVLEIPSTGGKLRKPGYDFCTQFCNKDPTASLFTYIETGVDFETYERCNLPYGNTLDKYLNDVPQWVIDICGPNDFACIMDVANGDATDAIELRRADLEYASVCSPPGGNCDERKCCGDSKCVAFGGLAGSVCDGDESLGVPEFGSCKENPKCQEGLACVPLENGDAQCRLDLPCQKDWMSCNENDDCCDNSVCMENKNTGIKQCRKLPSCMKQWDDCSIVGCCGDLKCVQQGKSKQCMHVPDCWNRQNKDCTTIPCCGGLTCVQDPEGRNLCKKLPTCVKKNRNCLWSPCCDDPANPLQCVEVTDKTGRQTKQCQLAPGGADIRVFDDINGNGVQDEGEPGIPGVELQLVDNRKKPFQEDKTNGGNVHEVLTTDINGLVSFQSVPKNKPLKVKVVKAPPGSIPTRARRGKDRNMDSDLNGDGFSSSFYVKGLEAYKGTSLGFLMPVDVEIEVFNDLNSNGIRDDGEEGIRGVKIHLETSNKKNRKFHSIEDLGNGGNAHEELVTDESGKVIFTEVPQDMKLRAKVLEAPPGAIPTTRNAKRNKEEEADSDLRNDGTTDEFYTKGDDDGYVTKVDLGYRMPETVIVRVWDDTDGDGTQDKGEIGIQGVKLQLITDKQKQPLADYGGNSHLVVSTDNEGLATFTKVPQGMKLRVKVIEKPDGAIKTKSNQGKDDTVDSDLHNDDLSYPFTMASNGAPFSSLDLGYSMPGSMVVRVWDDENQNGLQDNGEVGLEGVKLRLVDKNKKKPLTESGGNSHLELETDKDGFVTFTGVPQGQWLRVHVVDKPKGAIPTAANRGKNKEDDSDLQTDGYSDQFKMKEGDYTEIDLGYKMPEDVVIRVWDDENANGLQDDGEVGIEGVGLRLVHKKGRKNLEDIDTGGNCHAEITTDADGFAKFTKVPKGIDLQVKITNAPAGAVMTKANANRNKAEDKDSDFRTNNFSSHFNLRKFVGSTFSSIDLGYKMPDDLQVRVWDDVNLNGIQDADEPGIEGVELQLINDKGKKPLDGYTTLVTGEDGYVTFPQVTKATKVRVKVLNPPKGAVVTKRNQHKKKGGTEDNDSDLGGNMITDAFSLASFIGDLFGKVDIGFRMPDDMEIKVWDDVNGNGIQEEGEPGIEGVEIQLLHDRGRKPLENIGGGSNAHEIVKTDVAGIAKFFKVPKATKLRAKVLNAPPGSTYTAKANHKKTDATEETDSDLNRDMTSDRFSLSSFAGAGAYGALDLGFRMPKRMVVRAWNDANENGIQDDGEEDLAGVKIKIVKSNGKDLPQQGPNSTAHFELETDATGRVAFEEVPQGIDMKIKVTKKPSNYKKVTKKRKGSDRQLDSDLNSNMFTDKFKLPSNVEEMFDLVDLGFVLK